MRPKAHVGGPKAIVWLGAAGLLTVLAPQAMAQPTPPSPSAKVDTPTAARSLASVIAAMPKNLPRAKGPPLKLAIDAALAAEQACAARGAKVSVLIADSVGAPVVLLSGDGAGVRSQLIARTKVNIVARFGTASGEVETRARTETALARTAAADPEIGVLRGGGFPLTVDGAVYAIVAVSGGSLGGDLTLDDACAKVALATLRSGLAPANGGGGR